MKKFVIPLILISFILVLFFVKVEPKNIIKCPYVESSSDSYSLSIISTIQEKFGISNYTLLSADCSAEFRGWNMSATIESEGLEYGIYYKYGWCTSAGSDCGWTSCFRSSAGSTPLYENVKSKICNSLQSYQNEIVNLSVIGKIYDNTSEVRTLCKSGYFEEVDGNQKKISIRQDSSRTGEISIKSNIDC